MLSVSDICSLIFSLAVLVYILVSQRTIKELKSQNGMLSELLIRTNDAAKTLRRAHYSDNKNQSSDKVTRGSMTKDGNKPRDTKSN